MKVKAIARSDAGCMREKNTVVHELPRNITNPNLHPFAKAREYTRAVVAAKLDRMMAKPFVAALSGHRDGIYSIACAGLDRLYSGAADGEIKVWSLAGQSCLHTFRRTHDGIVKGLAAIPGSMSSFLSCGTDRFARLWDHGISQTKPVATFSADYGLNSISHHFGQQVFATAGVSVDIWNHTRSTPVTKYEWGENSVNCVRFNPTETSILASTGSDRAVVLYDTRMPTPLRRVVLELSSNAVCWNPMEPFLFAVANEDHNCYVFDMRHMESAINIFRDHVSAVLDLDYSPTGAELVTGAYDRTIRLFDVRSGRSRDVYHAQRMQRVWSVRFSLDSKYVAAASDDGNVRLWKAAASEKLGVVSAREAASLQALKAVKEKHMHMPEVRRIAKHRIVPRAITRASKIKSTMIKSRKRKEENIRSNKRKDLPRIDERRKTIVCVNE